MTHIKYINGILHVDDVDIPSIAREVGTPFYVFSASQIEDNFLAVKNSVTSFGGHVFYAMKANSNQAILKLLFELGAGFDVVSGGEYQRAKAVGCPADRIVFSGVGKTSDEMELALTGGIRQFNVESFSELHLLDSVAGKLGLIAPIAVRMNPDVDAETHEKISTGKAQNKFGVPITRVAEFFQVASGLSNINLLGLDIHIGSQITSLKPYEKAFEKVASLIREKNLQISRLDLGGGLGVTYHPLHDNPPKVDDYSQLVRQIFGDMNLEIEIEPGRFIVADSGILVAKVLYRKKGENRDFLVIDAAMNDLIRPAMYSSYHEIKPIRETIDKGNKKFDVVGPICESSDTFTENRNLPEFEPDDLMAFMTAGAYSTVMVSEYNTRPAIAEILVKGDKWACIKKSPTVTDMINRDIIPSWL
ncbi:MAG: diaminopimelate decarboxylase [Paracoccaceae bacterium]|nr:diaminopimelate decarboxylase [Paracoccaceae bacterium]MXZ49777.1 diaminopimelate decarboxylase [Paracoccaceae bacterium]MYF45345.1 diaminopimelate decarboxylase [Paracoccaceae bacterium]MYI91643.1 diaminopimelate decarboxylase [Paracoccaceae bacterium]